jgi:hypothetical protein
MTFSDLCKQREMMGRDEQLNDAAEVLNQAEAEYGQVRGALLAWIR